MVEETPQVMWCEGGDRAGRHRRRHQNRTRHEETAMKGQAGPETTTPGRWGAPPKITHLVLIVQDDVPQGVVAQLARLDVVELSREVDGETWRTDDLHLIPATTEQAGMGTGRGYLEVSV